MGWWLTDYNELPFSMYVKELVVSDYSSGSTYSYSDKTGSYRSIKAANGAVYNRFEKAQGEFASLTSNPEAYSFENADIVSVCSVKNVTSTEVTASSKSTSTEVSYTENSIEVSFTKISYTEFPSLNTTTTNSKTSNHPFSEVSSFHNTTSEHSRKSLSTSATHTSHISTISTTISISSNNGAISNNISQSFSSLVVSVILVLFI